MTDDLIERLRADAASSKEGYQCICYVRTVTEAAARIATQQEAIDELVAGLRAFHDYHMSGGHVGELASIEFEGAALLSKHG